MFRFLKVRAVVFLISPPLKFVSSLFDRLKDCVPFDVDVAAELFNRGDFGLRLSYHLLMRWLVIFFAAATQQVLRLAVEIVLCFGLVAAVALCAPCKVVILTLTANPATIWKLKIAICFWPNLTFLFILGPLGATGVLTLLGDRVHFHFFWRHISRLIELWGLRHEESSVKDVFFVLRKVLAFARLKDRMILLWRISINAELATTRSFQS